MHTARKSAEAYPDDKALSQSPDLPCKISLRLHPCTVFVALLRLLTPKTVPWFFGASLSGAKRDSGRRRPVAIDSRTLHKSVAVVMNVSRRRSWWLAELGKAANHSIGPTYHSTVIYLTAFPPVLDTSFCILVAARPPPAPPFALTVPNITCVTVLRPNVMECRAPCAARRCLSLWSETRGAVEPFT